MFNIGLTPDIDPNESEPRKLALATNAHMRLMMKLLSFERTEEDVGACSGLQADASLILSPGSEMVSALRGASVKHRHVPWRTEAISGSPTFDRESQGLAS
jgi:hypothetical protein